MLKTRISFLLILLLSQFALIEKAFAFNEKLDSLLSVYATQPDDSNKVNDIVALALKAYKNGESQQALDLSNTSRTIAESIKFESGIAESYFIIARVYNRLNKPASALENFSKAQRIFQKLNSRGRLASLYNNVGSIYSNLGRYSNAVEFLTKSLEYYELSENQLGAASASINLGVVYRKLANYGKSAEAYFSALQLFEQLDHKINIAKTNSNLANLYIDQKEFNKALKFSQTAISILTELNDPHRIAVQLSNIASIYVELNKVDTAFVLLQEADSIFRDVEDEVGIAFSQDNIGDVYVLKGQHQLALESHQNALKLFRQLEKNGNIPEVLSSIGYDLMLLGKYDESLEYLQKGLAVSDSLGVIEGKLMNYERLHQLYEKKGNFELSLNYFKLHAHLKDSIYNETKSRQIASIEENYEIDKRERENDLLREQQATQNEVIKRQNLQVKVLIGGLITFLLFAIYYFRINQQKKKTNELLSQQNEEINSKQVEILAANQSLQLSEQQLHQANQELHTVNARLESTVKKRTSELQRTNHELDTFLYQSSHALRRPIVHVKGLVQLARLEPDPQEVVGLYDKLDDTATRMDLMLKKLVMASEIYVTEPEVEAIHFDELIKEVWDSLTDTLKMQTVKLEYTIPPNISFSADRKLLKIMFLNLLENAIFYNEATKRQRAVVTISLASNPKSIDVKVNDNGIGISEEAIASIFDLFSVGTDKTKGYGLGLYIVKKAVEKLQGVITVSSKRNEYTTFHITLPKETTI